MTMHRMIAALSAVGALGLAGCDFLSTRPAVPPVDSSPVCRTSRSTPLDLFTDVKCALDARSNGEPVYEDVLDENYLFVMDPQEAVSIGPPGSWGRPTDVSFLAASNLRLDSVRVEFSAQQETGVGQDAAMADTAHWTCTYLVTTRAAGVTDSTQFAGDADVTFRRGPGSATWAIYRWVDHKVSGLRTIGFQRRS